MLSASADMDSNFIPTVLEGTHLKIPVLIQVLTNLDK